jgi:hypothetical protein
MKRAKKPRSEQRGTPSPARKPSRKLRDDELANVAGGGLMQGGSAGSGGEGKPFYGKQK